MRLVSVVTRTRSLRSARARISSIRLSTWPVTGRTSICGIGQACRPDDLLDDHARRSWSVRRARAWPRHRSPGSTRCFEFLEIQRTVVQRRREPESVLYQVLLARPVAEIHAAHLRDRRVAFIHEQQRSRAACSPAASAAVRPAAVRSDGASSSRSRGSNPISFIISRSNIVRWCSRLRFEQFLLLFQLRPPLLQLLLMRLHGAQQLVPRLHVVGLRIDRQALVLLQNLRPVIGSIWAMASISSPNISMRTA